MAAAPTTQVKVSPSGPWHRRRGNGSGDVTACGIPIDGAYLSRDHALEGFLCPACFTSHERDTGEMKKIERGALQIAEAEQAAAEWLDPKSEEITDEIDVPAEGEPSEDKK